jgi:hypothetical protein
MQPVPAGGLAWVVVAGGGGGGECAAIVSVVGGGGGGVARVVIVSVGVEAAGGGGGAVVCIATAGTAVLCEAAWAWACRLCLWAGFVAARLVVVVVGAGGAGVDAVAVVAAAAVLAAVWVEVEDADPQALTSSVSSTAVAEVRSVFIVVSLPPIQWLVFEDAPSPRLLPADRKLCVKRSRRGSEQAVNAPPARSIPRADAATIRAWRTMSGARCSWSTTSPRSPRSLPAT